MLQMVSESIRFRHQCNKYGFNLRLLYNLMFRGVSYSHPPNFEYLERTVNQAATYISDLSIPPYRV
jgi:hypothetical protein